MLHLYIRGRANAKGGERWQAFSTYSLALNIVLCGVFQIDLPALPLISVK
jgi:hypothetical protein